MFGAEVNATTKGNVCTKASKDLCGAGEKVRALPVRYPRSRVWPWIRRRATCTSWTRKIIASTSTPEGQFVLEIGKEVNETTKGNVCTAASHDTCGAGVQGASEGPFEPAAFDFQHSMGDLLAAGGVEHRLYVGDEGSVQEFRSDEMSADHIALGGLSTTAFSFRDRCCSSRRSRPRIRSFRRRGWSIPA